MPKKPLKTYDFSTVSDPIIEQPKPVKRTRKVKSNDAVAPTKLEIEFVDEVKIPQQHDVIQITVGDHRGVLCQIADWNGSIYRCYVINPPNPPAIVNAKPGEFHFVGKAKVASRNPFPPQAEPENPNPPPEHDPEGD